MELNNQRILPINKIRIICTRLLTTTDSNRAIASFLKVSASSVNRLKRKLNEKKIDNLEWLLSLSEDKTYELFYLSESLTKRKEHQNKHKPDFNALATSMIEKKCTLKEIYEEYCQQSQQKELEALSFSHFSKNIIAAKNLIRAQSPDFYYAQKFPYGVYVQIDFTGDKYELLTFNGRQECYLMVLCFPASYYVYAEFVTGQTTAESCRVLGNAFRSFGNLHPSIVKCDNARCWVDKHSNGESIINRNFANYLQEIGMCAEASPVYKPQTKSSVEFSVRLIQVLMKSLKDRLKTEQNTVREHSKAVLEKIDSVINKGPFRRSSEITRHYLFKTYELPLLTKAKKIPEYLGDAESKVVPNSYLIKVKGHLYSVPYTFIRKRVDIYTTNDLVIIKYEGKEIARHLRTDGDGASIKDEHKPMLHQQIDRTNKLYRTTDDVLAISRELDDGVYHFCCSKIRYDTEEKACVANTIRCCRAVINAYKRVHYKHAFSEACTSVLTLPSAKWNSYTVNEMYEQVLKEYSSNKHFYHQTEIFRPGADGDAYLRNSDDETVLD